jgi:hypothetical protein
MTMPGIRRDERVGPSGDRRAANRPATPACARCQTNHQVACAVRTEYVLYFRCGACGDVWSIDKPPRAVPNAIR